MGISRHNWSPAVRRSKKLFNCRAVGTDCLKGAYRSYRCPASAIAAERIKGQEEDFVGLPNRSRFFFKTKTGTIAFGVVLRAGEMTVRSIEVYRRAVSRGEQRVRRNRFPTKSPRQRSSLGLRMDPPVFFWNLRGKSLAGVLVSTL